MHFKFKTCFLLISGIWLTFSCVKEKQILLNQNNHHYKTIDTSMIVSNMLDWLQENNSSIYSEFMNSPETYSNTDEKVINAALLWNTYFGEGSSFTNPLESISAISNNFENVSNDYATYASSNEQFIDIAIIGDSEFNMRLNNTDTILSYAQRGANIQSQGLKHKSSNFTASELALGLDSIKTPELVFLAGDCNKDRADNASIQNVHLMLDYFENVGATAIVGEGNHDWEPYKFFHDGPNAWGWTISGCWNARDVWRDMVYPYYNIIKNDPTKFPALYSSASSNCITTAPLNYMFFYKDVLFANLNTYLGEERGRMSIQSLFQTGPAHFSTTQFETDFSAFLNIASSSPYLQNIQKIFVQHYPLSTGDTWWDLERIPSEGALHKTQFKNLAADNSVTLFTGHDHHASVHHYSQEDITDYTTGTFSKGRILYVKISSTRGILAVTDVDLSNNYSTNYIK